MWNPRSTARTDQITRPYHRLVAHSLAPNVLKLRCLPGCASLSLDYGLNGGLAIGILPDSRYEERPVSLRIGDTMLLYTDGVNEAEDATGNQFGVERLEELLAELSDRSARQIVDGILDRVILFVGGPGELSDDLTLVCVKRLDPNPS